MSQIKLCRLCLNVCNDCKKLYCESGQINEIYQISVKYFHPIFLSMDQENKTALICLECWHHISDFHCYQQSVLQAQGKLLEEESQMELQAIQCTSSSVNANCSNPIKKEEDEDSMYAHPDIQEYDENDDNSNIPSYNSESSDYVGAFHYGLSNVIHEEIDIPETGAELLKGHSAFEDSIIEDNKNLNSDGNHVINTMKRKRTNTKSQTEQDSFLSQWRPHLECVVCGAMLTSFASLQRHFRQDHPTELCYISCCNRKLKSRAMIEEHARLHTDPNVFKCLKCGSKLGSEASLSTHRRKCLSSLEYCDPRRKPQRTNKSCTKRALEEIERLLPSINSLKSAFS